MSETIQLVTVFLASPGDLQDERRLVKDTERDLNSGIAKYLGFRVELKGWEDTLSGSGRPQEIINQELDQSDLFIGMMFKKWGTPPSTGKKYTSGFEEEFERSLERRKNTGKPEMAMYFKEIDDDYLVDPGTDLKKVLEFKKKLINGKFIYFESFNDPNELQRRARQKIEQHLIDIKNADAEGEEQQFGRPRLTGEDQVGTTTKELAKSPFSGEGHSFLTTLLDKAATEGGLDSISSFEVARFRLLSSAISKSGNDEAGLGVHDANIIFANRDANLGDREVSRLLECGLGNLKHENVPLWHWYGRYLRKYKSHAFMFKTFSNDSIGEGAMDVIRVVDPVNPFDDPPFDRSFFVRGWLHPDRKDELKVAALKYLKSHGLEEDIDAIQSEFDRADSKTSRIALEAIVSIQARQNLRTAITTAFSNQFDTFDDALLENLLQNLSEIDNETLRKGFVHGNEMVRLCAFREAVERGCVNDGEEAYFAKDASAPIRLEAVNYLLAKGESMRADDVRKLLIQPKKGTGFGRVASTGNDEEGQSCFEKYLFEKYCEMPRDDLLDIVYGSTSFEDIPYLALCTRYFAKSAKMLRQDVDSKFVESFEKYIGRLGQAGFPEDSIEKWRGLGDFVRKMRTRKALDVLCIKGDVGDRKRVRALFESDFIDSSDAEIAYLAKFGEWSDVPSILKAKKDSVLSRNSLSILAGNTEWNRHIAEAAYKIGKNRLDELMGQDMSHSILAQLVLVVPESKIKNLKQETVLKLLNCPYEQVRKYAALKCVLALSKSTLEALLEEYETNQDYRYYNVIVWLDCGVSMARTTAKRIVRAML